MLNKFIKHFLLIFSFFFFFVQNTNERDRFSVALYATEERSPELWSNRMWWEAAVIILINEEINEANGPDKIVAGKKLLKKKK